MNVDVAIPKNNEVEFLQIASRLGIGKPYFLYDFSGFDIEKIRKKIELAESDVEAEIGIIVSQKNYGQAYKQSKFLAAKSSSEDRQLIESGKVRLIYGFEGLQRRDYLHQRASGLNHILCELAAEKKVAIGLSYSQLLSNDRTTASNAMGRMMQNIRLCRKYGVKTIIGAFSEKPYEMRAPHDIQILFRVIGMPSQKML